MMFFNVILVISVLAVCGKCEEEGTQEQTSAYYVQLTTGHQQKCNWVSCTGFYGRASCIRRFVDNKGKHGKEIFYIRTDELGHLYPTNSPDGNNTLGLSIDEVIEQDVNRLTLKNKDGGIIQTDCMTLKEIPTEKEKEIIKTFCKVDGLKPITNNKYKCLK